MLVLKFRSFFLNQISISPFWFFVVPVSPAHTNIHTHTQAHMHTRIHAHSHTHIRTLSPPTFFQNIEIRFFAFCLQINCEKIYGNGFQNFCIPKFSAPKENSSQKTRSRLWWAPKYFQGIKLKFCFYRLFYQFRCRYTCKN